MLIFLTGRLLFSHCFPLDKSDLSISESLSGRQVRANGTPRWEGEAVSGAMGPCRGQSREAFSRSGPRKHLADEFIEESHICIIILSGYRMTRDDMRKVAWWDGG